MKTLFVAITIPNECDIDLAMGTITRAIHNDQLDVESVSMCDNMDTFLANYYQNKVVIPTTTVEECEPSLETVDFFDRNGNPQTITRKQGESLAAFAMRKRAIEDCVVDPSSTFPRTIPTAAGSVTLGKPMDKSEDIHTQDIDETSHPSHGI